MKRFVYLVIASILLCSCSEEQKAIVAEDFGIGECFNLGDKFKRIQSEFFASIDGLTDVVFVSKEMSVFYEKAKSIRGEAESCVFELYNKQVDPQMKQRMMSITSTLGKGESIIFTHLSRINSFNLEEELWALETMLKEGANTNP